MDIRVLGSGSKGNCYVVSDGVSTLLFECGLPMKDIRKGLHFNLAGINGVLISHEHIDHGKAAKDFANTGIPIYTRLKTAEVLKIPLYAVKQLGNDTERIGTFQVRVFELIHDAVDPIGWIAKSTVTGETVLYITDTMYCPYSIQGVHHLMIESNYTEEGLRESDVPESLKSRIRKNHMSQYAVLDFIEKMDRSVLKSVMLLHLSDNHSNAENMKKQVQELTGVPVTTA